MICSSGVMQEVGCFNRNTKNTDFPAKRASISLVGTNTTGKLGKRTCSRVVLS